VDTTDRLLLSQGGAVGRLLGNDVEDAETQTQKVASKVDVHVGWISNLMGNQSQNGNDQGE
jgi:hypothetical protein